MPRSIQSLLTNGSVLAVAAIIFTAVLTYGPGIPQLGYYHDDWYMLWDGSVRGPNALMPLFKMDRPFMGVIYALTYGIIRENLLVWHIYTLAWRIIGAFAFYWILNLAWPKMKGVFVLATILFLVYPGFLSIPNAATKINHLTGFGAALFSIAFTLKAIQATQRGLKWAYTGASLLLAAFYLWIYEYMIGLEVMRVLLMLWMYWQGVRQKALPVLKSLIRDYLPYAGVVAVFLFWRVFLFDSTRSATDMRGVLLSYYNDAFGLALQVVFQIVKDFFAAALFAWGVQPYQLFTRADNSGLTSAFLLAAGAILIAAGYLFAARKGAKIEDQENGSVFAVVATGAIIVLATVTPVVATFRSLNLLDPYKSYGLHPSAGVIILVIGLVSMLKPRFRSPLLIALIALSVATQSLNNQDWARKWEIQKNFWWQLTWRAPDIKDYTLLMAYIPERYAFQQDYEVWGPVNLIYNPGRSDFPAIQSEVLNHETMLNLMTGLYVERNVRNLWLPTDYRNLLLVSQPTPASCIHIIDGQMPVYPPNERLIVRQVGSRSNVDFIDTSGTPPIPPATIFGQEPERGWCYHFQQASLARQTGDWQRIEALYASATAAGLTPSESFEYFVFIEGLVNAGRRDLAESIIANGLREDTALIHSWCTSLASAPAYPASFGYRREELTALICQ